MGTKTLTLIFILAAIVILGNEINSSIGKAIENQDTMLCESAKVSGNQQYLSKCGCYYNTGDIKCLQN